MAEQVRNGEMGRLIPPGDTDALRGALTDLCSDQATLAAMGERGHERLVAEDWTWPVHTERVRRLHRAAIDRTAVDTDA